MTPRWTVAVVVVLAVVGVVTPAFAMPAADESADNKANPFEPLPSNETNATTGSQISAFMASSSMAVDSSVETGMWIARFNDSDTNKTEMVERRASVLRNRLDTLEARLDERNASGNVSLGGPSDAREVASLNARIDALNSTIERTQTAAREDGVNTTRLDRLRENASRLHGHEVARTARNLTTVGPPANRGPNGGGPPGQADNRTDSTGPEETPGAGPNATGPEETPGAGPNETGETGHTTADRPDNTSGSDRTPESAPREPDGRSDGTNETAPPNPERGDTDDTSQTGHSGDTPDTAEPARGSR
ncbi:MAG: hypothetical protein ACOCPX_03860 [Halapricum sp.]